MANLEFRDTHNMVAYLKKTKGSEGFHQIFWQTATASTLDNGDIEITATIDGKVKTVSEASIRRHLKLEDSDGISNLPTTEIFKQLALMGRITKQESMVPQPRSPTQTNVADKAASTGVDVRLRGATTTVTGLEAGHGSANIDKTPTMPHDSPLPRVNTLGSDEGTRGKAKLVVSDDEEDLEDPSKQGRKIVEIDQDPDISLLQHDAEVQGRHEHDMESDFDFTAAEEVYIAKKGVSTTEPVSTVGASVSTTSASSAKDKSKDVNTRISIMWILLAFRVVPVKLISSCLVDFLKKYLSSTRLLHDPFISSNVGPTNKSGVRVSTLSRLITNAEKSRGVSISSLNESRVSSFLARLMIQG
ncbi:hypothetical protein Tco_0066216 [Tanacetum coccineum]